MTDRLFDLIVVVDWSSNSTPKTGNDSIWSSALDAETGDRSVVNHRTRHAAEASVRDILRRAAGRRVLIGFDFPYGYPAGFAAVLGGPTATTGWQKVWSYLSDEIRDDDRNANNRFDVAARMNAWVAPDLGPFWGCPPARASVTLHTHKRHTFPVDGPAGPIGEFRLAEHRLFELGRRPSSAWQTAYAGSVGSQALVGIPVVSRLLDDPDLAPRSVVWPFHTGLTADPTAGRHDLIVHAEIWPGTTDLDLDRHEVRDAAQVIGLCDHFAALDRRGELGALFRPEVGDDETVVVEEEGWILGV